MTLVVLLDAGPLGLLTSPNVIGDNVQCVFWLRSLPSRDCQPFVPELADYEVRRELLRIGSRRSLRRLDELKGTIGHLPITTPVVLRAAALWAQSRRAGRPLSDPQALDCDVMLAAQAQLLAEAGARVVVATTNVGHLSQFVDARHWRDIP